MLSVAHFRRTWFKTTETFLYNYISSFQESSPFLIGYTRANEAQFPVTCPVLTLYDHGIWSWWERRMRPRLLGKRPATPPFACLRTYRAIAKAGIQLLHAHFGYTGYHALAVKNRTKLPLVTTFYGEDISHQAEEPQWQERYAELFDSGDLFLIEGPFMRKRLIHIGCPEKKSAIQRIAIRCDLYPFRTRLPKKKAEPVRILFCGTFREKKGLQYALEAVAQAQKGFPNLEFCIVGDGILRPKIEASIKQKHMENYTKLIGFVTHERMIKEMNNSDILIQPSVTAENGDSEGGAPTTILEAQACGIPVLASYHADIPNVVVPEGSALLASERDVDSLFQNLMTLLNDQERWPSMGLVGRSHIEKQHNILNEVKLLEQRYHELVL